MISAARAPELHAAAIDAGVSLRAHFAACRTCGRRGLLCATGYGLVRASQAAWRAWRLAGGRLT